MADIITSFDSLPPSPSDGTRTVSFHTVRFGTASRHHLAKSFLGYPVLLIETSFPSGSYPAPLRLEHLSVMHGYTGELETRDGTVTGAFTIVECHVADTALVASFLRLSAHLLEGLPQLPDPRSVAIEVRKLVHIFQALRQPPAKSIQGLWAELFVLANSPDISRWAAAWHQDPLERYDFAMQRLRIEVKSSGNRIRRHIFSHEQLHPPSDVTLWIASVFIERSTSGIDCNELLRRIQTRVLADAAFNVESIAMRTLGPDFPKARDFKFDEALASDSLSFVAVESIPRLSEDLPDGVSEVRYSVLFPQTVALRSQYPKED